MLIFTIAVAILLIAAVYEVIKNRLVDKGYQKGWNEAEDYFKKRKI